MDPAPLQPLPLTPDLQASVEAYLPDLLRLPLVEFERALDAALFPWLEDLDEPAVDAFAAAHPDLAERCHFTRQAADHRRRGFVLDCYVELITHVPLDLQAWPTTVTPSDDEPSEATHQRLAGLAPWVHGLSIEAGLAVLTALVMGFIERYDPQAAIETAMPEDDDDEHDLHRGREYLRAAFIMDSIEGGLPYENFTLDKDMRLLMDQMRAELGMPPAEPRRDPQAADAPVPGYTPAVVAPAPGPHLRLSPLAESAQSFKPPYRPAWYPGRVVTPPRAYYAGPYHYPALVSLLQLYTTPQAYRIAVQALPDRLVNPLYRISPGQRRPSLPGDLFYPEDDTPQVAEHYFRLLPRLVYARCPLCQAELGAPVDLYNLQPWGDITLSLHRTPCFGRRSEAPPPCPHFTGLVRFTNLHGRFPAELESPAPHMGIFHQPAGEVPYLTPGLLPDGMDTFAVLHALPICGVEGNRFVPHYTVFLVSYFAEDPKTVREWHWQEHCLDRDDIELSKPELDPVGTVSDLAAWARAGKLGWLGLETGQPLWIGPGLELPTLYRQINGDHDEVSF